ncbi:MAG: hypothetical protein KGI29_06240 [Pseudomonadota bacterium]|nr:hypothetical protein [Pseudomonadota bacterium]MDE3038652.1 hypothetical protein [Pseudomonadota bacterium]
MKYQEIRKQLLKESAAIATAVAVLVGVVYYFDAVEGNYQKESTDLYNQVAGIRNQTNRLYDQYSRVQKNTAIYREAMEKNANHQLTISRQAVREHFGKLRDRYYLNNVHLTMSPITAMAESQYKRNTVGMESSDITLSFEAISDEYVYDMLEAMQQELPGSSRVNQLTLTLTQPLTSGILREISQKGTFPLVSGKIEFTWFGVSPMELSNSDAGVPQKK